ncbi:hypothetical protein C0J52_06747 [Blattella germanica]|nr:hypothetical protein C0J52_06747 [Blattella germanica]
MCLMLCGRLNNHIKLRVPNAEKTQLRKPMLLEEGMHLLFSKARKAPPMITPPGQEPKIVEGHAEPEYRKCKCLNSKAIFDQRSFPVILTHLIPLFPFVNMPENVVFSEQKQLPQIISFWEFNNQHSAEETASPNVGVLVTTFNTIQVFNNYQQELPFSNTVEVFINLDSRHSRSSTKTSSRCKSSAICNTIWIINNLDFQQTLPHEPSLQELAAIFWTLNEDFDIQKGFTSSGRVFPILDDDRRGSEQHHRAPPRRFWICVCHLL